MNDMFGIEDRSHSRFDVTNHESRFQRCGLFLAAVPRAALRSALVRGTPLASQMGLRRPTELAF